ncbi:CPBP family glutamic-type intramembrane protease [Micromonosporaceae bacterium Da 78-11]
MFAHLSNTARAVTYYLMALGMCVALSLAWPDGEAAAVLAMLTPVLSVLPMQLVVTRDGWRRSGWAKLGPGRLGAGVWAVAVLVPFAILLASESVVRLTGLIPWHLPSGDESLILLTDLPVMLVLVLFEEIGWRGYLGPLLAADGRRAPHLRTGLLHGIWHLPLVYFATDGYLTEGNRWLIVPVFLAVLTCAGQFYGRLREISGSVYPAVLTHTAFNMGLSIAVHCTVTADPDAVAALGREAGVATLAVTAVAALWVTTWRTRVAPTGTSGPGSGDRLMSRSGPGLARDRG